MENFAKIQLKRTNKTWLYAWSGNGRFFYFINQANIRFSAALREYGRNALNAAILGLKVYVNGSYDKQTRILTIEP